MSHWVASPVDEEAELQGWRQLSARALNAANISQARCVALQVLRFWEAIGYVGIVADLATSVRFYQEQVEIALELR